MASPFAQYASFCVLAISLLTQTAQPAGATEPCEPVVGRFISVEGSVEVQRSGQGSWRAGELDQPLCQDDTIRVGERSRAAVSLINDAVLRLDQRTTMRLLDIAGKEEKRSLLELILGALQSFSRAPRTLAVNTPYLNGLVEGTEFVVRVEADRATFTVFEGKVAAANDFGRLLLASGESAVAKKGEAPQPQIVVRPRDAVQWALYYPPVLYLRPDEFPPGPGWQGMVRRSIEFYLRGDLQKALDAIVSVPGTTRDPRFFAYRAHLLLAVGRVDEAGADIERALRLAPNDSNALALQTIIAVVQNEKDKALNIAQKAVQAAPNSATAQIALSYAQQARFDLEGARASLEKAVKLEPNNALAWARLAELHSSFGHLDKALSAAQQAIALEPNLSRTQTVLGYVYLTQVKVRQAKEAFEKAITLDQADPLPRLGLGLARIRESDLHEGRREIEVAASLDPNNSIVRSYLGKAYFEEKRTALTDREYPTAKELDPKDPTPFFYDAIQKQTTNRPVEALQDVQKAIELNDNRAVYRSRLLLDSDLAARSASLGRIYTDLGFQQLALVEGWKSVNTDPTNFSAHRFLADSYSVLPRHEIARVSELLQSQLLQPLNMTPIQPRLAESNLFLISAGGPGGLSFNEFNPIFNRDGVTFQTNGLVGENSTYAGEGVLAGIYGKASFSLGYSHFETDGFRQNSGQDDDIGNAFLQLDLSPKTSIQGEYRYRNTERGDLRLRFFPEDVFPDERNKEERHTVRLGVRHAFSPSSIVLGSFIYSDADVSVRENQLAPPVTFLEVKDPQTSFSAELQHLFRSRYVNLTSGAGYAKVDGDRDITVGFDFPPPDDIIQSPRESRGVTHTNLYAYSYLNLLKDVTFILGASGDITSGDSLDFKDTSQFNPKFGIVWNPFPATTVRAAAFRVLKRRLITNQTLEPTQVAGFNQFYDDLDATEAWRYGGAIDQKFTQDIFGGVEFSQRDLSVPILDIEDPENPVFRAEDRRERLGRAYLFWTPHAWVALRLEYMFERFTTDGVTDQPKALDTHRIPVGISFFHPSGLSASLKATYFNQNGTFVLNDESVRSGRDDFWTVDAGINYRLPKRYGFITIGATNLFDEEFKFFDRDLNNPSIQPDRTFFAKITLALP